MCYYHGQRVTRAEFIQLKQLEKAVKKYDFIHPGVISGFSDVPVAVLKPNEEKNDFEIVPMEWGLLPGFVRNREQVATFRNGYKDSKGIWHKGYTTLNAKAENLFISESGKESMFADAVRNRRCLVLSTGIFEWRHIYRNHKKTGLPLKTPDKYPYFIHIKDKEYFFMLGFWQGWTDKDTGEYVETLAIPTTQANHLMMQVHNSKERMPSIPNDDIAWEWMMEDLTDERIMQIAKMQYPAELMEACTINKEFQASLNPAEPFEYADVPALELAL